MYRRMKRTDSRGWSVAKRDMIKTNVKWPGIAKNNKTRVIDELRSKHMTGILHFNIDLINILFAQKTLYGLGQNFDAWYWLMSWNSPGLPCWWRAVDSRLAWTATRLPPTPRSRRSFHSRTWRKKTLPFMTGWKAATPWSACTAKSRIRPPALFEKWVDGSLFEEKRHIYLDMSMAATTGDQPCIKTSLTYSFRDERTIQIGVKTKNTTVITIGNHV